MRTLFDIYCADLEWGGVGLGEGAPTLILEQATVQEKQAVAGWVRAAMDRGDGRSDGFERQAHGRFLLDLEMEQLGRCLLPEHMPRGPAVGRSGGSPADAGTVGGGDC